MVGSAAGEALAANKIGGDMKKLVQRAVRDDKGMTTAEYAVGTVAAAGLGGILIKLLASDEVRTLVLNVISSAFSRFFGG